MAESGAVTWNFESKGFIVVPKDGMTEDEIFEKAIEAGADDVNTEGDVYEITTEPSELHTVVAALEDAEGKFEEAKLTMLPKTTTEVDAKVARQVFKLIEMLEDNDDVQQVYSNVDVSEEDMAAMSAGSEVPARARAINTRRERWVFAWGVVCIGSLLREEYCILDGYSRSNPTSEAGPWDVLKSPAPSKHRSKRCSTPSPTSRTFPRLFRTS